MLLASHAAVCAKKSLIAHGVYELRFTKPAGFAFRPGQFILLDVPHAGSPEDVQARALSIASTPDENDLLFVVKIVTGGRLGRWVEEALREGVAATFKGPFGNFVLDKPAPPPPASPPRPGLPISPPAMSKVEGRQWRRQGNFLFIATGAGIAPFRPMALEAAVLYPDRRIDVVFGAWSEEDLFWAAGAAAHDPRRMDFGPNAFLHVTLAAPSACWTGHRGFVQSVAPRIMKNDFAGVSLYACGNPDMTADVKRLALSEWGMNKEDVHVDGYV